MVAQHTNRITDPTETRREVTDTWPLTSQELFPVTRLVLIKTDGPDLIADVYVFIENGVVEAEVVSLRCKARKDFAAGLCVASEQLKWAEEQALQMV
jgi:hypothetical protein